MFSLVPSIILRCGYIGLLFFGVLFLWLLPCASFIKIIASIVLIILGIIVYRKKLKSLEFIKLKQLDKDNWLLQTELGNVFQGQLLGDSIINSIFSIVILKSEKTKQTKKLLICRDMLTKMQYHQLVLGLRGLL